jgi:hypothetical protein
MDGTLFLLQLGWIHEIFKDLTIEKNSIHYTQEQKKKLALKALHFPLV